VRNESPDTYRVAWEKIRQASRRATIGVWTFVGVAIVLGGSMPRGSSMRVVVAALMVLIGAIVFVTYLAQFRCPRCGKGIFRRTSNAGYSQGQCPHCGIKVGTPSDG
jgi:DNA-directed RNA polymerase subunit RPC12/RpoP